MGTPTQWRRGGRLLPALDKLEPQQSLLAAFIARVSLFRSVSAPPIFSMLAIIVSFSKATRFYYNTEDSISLLVYFFGNVIAVIPVQLLLVLIQFFRNTVVSLCTILQFQLFPGTKV